MVAVLVSPFVNRERQSTKAIRAVQDVLLRSPPVGRSRRSLAMGINRSSVTWCARAAMAVGGLFFCYSLTSAQNLGGSITGVVRDPSGAVMPGVTVEAASPALIEKVVSAVS